MNIIGTSLIIIGLACLCAGVLVLEQNRKRIYCIHREIRYVTEGGCQIAGEYSDAFPQYVTTGKVLTEIEIENEVTK